MKIKVLIPNSGMDRTMLNARESMLSRAVAPDVQISVDCIPTGPVSIESNTDEVLAAPLLIEAAIRAEEDGYNAFVVYCFSDLAIQALRENVSIPVIGPGEASLAVADIISNRFAVITTTEKNISRTRRRLLQNSVAQRKMSSVRALNIPVAALRENAAVTCEYLKNISIRVMREEKVDTVILGCLGMAQYGQEIERTCGIKVIDPAFLAVAWAEMCARLDIRPSEHSVSRMLKRE